MRRQHDWTIQRCASPLPIPRLLDGSRGNPNGVKRVRYSLKAPGRMIQTVLLAAVLASAPSGGNLSDVCLDLLPSESGLIIRVDSLAAVLEKADEDKGAWERFVTDMRLADAFATVIGGAGEATESLSLLDAFARSIDGGALAFLINETDKYEYSLAGAFHARSSFPKALARLGESEGAVLLQPELLGRPAVRISFGETEIAFMEASGLWLMVSSDTGCLLYTSPSPRDLSTSRMPSSA